MHLRQLILSVVLISCTLLQVKGQESVPSLLKADPEDQTAYSYFIRSSYYSFTNWLKVGEIPNIYFYELHIGKEIDHKNKLGAKLARVKLFQPLGIQVWNLDVNSKSEWFDGRIEEYGLGGFYQRNLWKGLYASAEIMPFLKVFLDEQDNRIDKGFRLYTSWHIGYHIPLFKDRIFIEPQIHSQYWPVNTKGPSGFREQVERNDNYFLFEPNIYIGIKFN